jgi:hypothetical protein
MPANKLSNLWSETLKILNKARSKKTYFDIRVDKDDKLKVFQNKSGKESELFDFHDGAGGSGTITSVSAGTGISGGGTSGGVSVALDASELTALGTAPASGDFIVVQDITDNSTKKVTVSNLTSTIDADITSVVAGAGMTGGATEGAATLNVIAGTGITVNADDVQTNDSQIVHDNLSGFVANEHIDHSGVSITAGTGLSGGGDLTSTRTLSVDLSELTDMTQTINSAQDELILLDNGSDRRKLISEIPLSAFNNDSGFTTTAGTVTEVTVGTGLDVSNGTTTPSITLDLSEFTDMTANVNGAQDELILLDNGSERRKLLSEIDLSAFDNDSGWTSNAGTVTSVTVGTGLDISNGTTTPNITLDISEIISGDGANRVLTSDGDDTFTAESGLTYDGSTLTVTGDLNVDSNTLFIDASDNDIRIGTSTAVSTEKVLIRQTSTGVNTGIMLSKGSSAGDEYLALDISDTDTAMITAGAYGTGDCALAFRTSDSSEAERMRINKSGLVGIGTTSPNAGLHIDISGEPQLLLDGGDNSHGDLVVPDGEILQIGHWNDGSDTFTGRITMDTDGDIGFGVASPDSRLHINCGTTNTAKEDGIRLAADNDDWYIYPKRISSSTTNVNLQFNADGNEYGYIDDGGSNDMMNFTGQHRCLASSSTDFQTLSGSVGKIVVASGQYDNPNTTDSITINETIPTIKLSNERNQKSAFGVVSNAEDPDQEDRTYNFGAFGTNRQKKSSDDVRIHVNSLGEGGIWVTNINGDLENGDYITTCEMPGYGMKQDSEMLCNYTVAKITMDCDFDKRKSYECIDIEHEGVTYRAAFVGCTYHCG